MSTIYHVSICDKRFAWLELYETNRPIWERRFSGAPPTMIIPIWTTATKWWSKSRCALWENKQKPCSTINTHSRNNSLRPRQSRHHFADDIFKCIILNENARISLKISLKFVPKIRINNIPALVPIMAWRQPGDKPLSEPMMAGLLTHICVTWPQWDNGRMDA